MQRLLRTLPPAARSAVDTRNIRLSPQTPALIAEGAKMQYDAEQGPKGPQATNVIAQS